MASSSSRSSLNRFQDEHLCREDMRLQDDDDEDIDRERPLYDDSTTLTGKTHPKSYQLHSNGVSETYLEVEGKLF